MKKALLIIDMQNVCIGENHADKFHYENEKLIRRVNEKIAEYPCENVIYIRNIMKHNLLNRFAPFHAYEGSEEAQLVSELNVVNQQILTKYKGDAFTNPKLVELLRNHGIDELELVGVDGGGCIPLTALGAVKAGFHVTIISDAVGTSFEKQAARLEKKLFAAGVHMG